MSPTKTGEDSVVERTVVSLAASAFVACCGLASFLTWEALSEPKVARAQTTGTCPNAQLIDTFEGNGDQQTDTFNTTTNSLRISYSVTSSDPQFPASLFIDVIDANDPDQLPVGDAEQNGDGGGETFVNSPAGTYFLDITLFGSGNFTITVGQCEGGNPSQGTPEASAPETTTLEATTVQPPTVESPAPEATAPQAVRPAQNQRSRADEGCANPQPVVTFSGTENQVTAPFEITGETFRLRYETAPNGPDPFLPTVDIEVLNQNGQPIGEGPLVFEGEDGSENILAGPGTFGLEIRAEEASYNITVEDCIGTPSGNPVGGREHHQGRVDSPVDVIRKTRVVKIPNTGGPPYLAVGALALLGAALIAGRAVLRR
jgi:hypothetical protein